MIYCFACIHLSVPASSGREISFMKHLLSTWHSARRFPILYFTEFSPKCPWSTCCLLHVVDNETVTHNWCLPKGKGLVSLGFQSLFLPGTPCWFRWIVNGTLHSCALWPPNDTPMWHQRPAWSATQDPAMPAVIFTPISIVFIYGTEVSEKGLHLLKTQPIHSSNSFVVDICFVLIKINLCRKTIK